MDTRNYFFIWHHTQNRKQRKCKLLKSGLEKILGTWFEAVLLKGNGLCSSSRDRHDIHHPSSHSCTSTDQRKLRNPSNRDVMDDGDQASETVGKLAQQATFLGDREKRHIKHCSGKAFVGKTTCIRRNREGGRRSQSRVGRPES